MRDHRERDLRTEECRYLSYQQNLSIRFLPLLIQFISHKYLNAENMLHGLSMDYVFASVVSFDCNNSNGLWTMYCVVCRVENGQDRSG